MFVLEDRASIKAVLLLSDMSGLIKRRVIGIQGG
jgi:hypothetical protein